MIKSRSIHALLVGALFISSPASVLAQSTDTEAAPDVATDSAQPSDMQEHTGQDMATMDNESDPADGILDGTGDEQHKAVYEAFLERFPGVPVESFTAAPYDGLFEVITEGRIIYVDAAMKTLFQGEIIDLDTGTNMTESRLSGIHMGLINSMGEDNMLVYKPSGEDTGRSITVFTDINCGYCRLLHSEIDTLLQAGVSVRYLMFPRAGLDTDSSVALESVWCDADPQAAMTSAKAGEPIQHNECETPIEQHYALAGQVGLRGTPLIYLDSGTAIPGYREAKVLVEMISSSEPMQ